MPGRSRPGLGTRPLQLGTPELDDAEMFGVDARGRTFLKISPPIRRTKVIPEPWRTNILVRGWRRLTGRSNPPKPKRALPRPAGSGSARCAGSSCCC